MRTQPDSSTCQGSAIHRHAQTRMGHDGEDLPVSQAGHVWNVKCHSSWESLKHCCHLMGWGRSYRERVLPGSVGAMPCGVMHWVQGEPLSTHSASGARQGSQAYSSFFIDKRKMCREVSSLGFPGDIFCGNPCISRGSFWHLEMRMIKTMIYYRTWLKVQLCLSRAEGMCHGLWVHWCPGDVSGNIDIFCIDQSMLMSNHNT